MKNIEILRLPNYNISMVSEMRNDFYSHKGEIVISSTGKVARFIGIGMDSEEYYNILFDGKKVYWESVLVNFIVLKNKIDDNDYASLIRDAEMNHLDKVNPDFEISVCDDSYYLPEDICWDLN